MKKLVATVLSLVACSPEALPLTAGEQPRPETQPVAHPGMSERMTDHFSDSVRLKDAVIDGELDEVRVAATHLALRLGEDRYPPSWQPHVHAAARLAEAARTAEELRSAAMTTGALGVACGGCHAAEQRGPRFAVRDPAPFAGLHDTKLQMARHQWAADRMWEALVSRSDSTWSAGAEALAGWSLDVDALTADVELSEDVLHLGDRVHALAEQARGVPDWEARGALYGEFLASCASCHRGGC